MELTSVEMNECQKFCEYMEREWFRKDHNLFNFNNVGRVRGINAAEAYHSALKKFPILNLILILKIKRPTMHYSRKTSEFHKVAADIGRRNGCKDSEINGK